MASGTIEVVRPGTGRVRIAAEAWPGYRAHGFVLCPGEVLPEGSESAGGAQEVEAGLEGVVVPPASPEPSGGEED